MLKGKDMEGPECRTEDTYTEGNYMNRQLVRTVRECQADCEHMAIYIMRESDYRSRIKQASLLADCADICCLTAKCAARGSVYARQITSLCEDVCQDCAAECARFADCMSQGCADICARCAKECDSFTGVL